MAVAGDIRIRLSGGAANTDPNASLGGIMSTTEGAGQAAPGIANVTGVTLLYASFNPLGNGTLSYVNATQSLTWAANGDTAGNAVPVGTDGTYTVYSSSGGFVTVTVVAASLPGSDQNDTLGVANTVDNVFDTILTGEATGGDIEYRCLYITNEHATDDALDVRVYIRTQPNGADDWAMGLDPAGIGDGSTTGVATTIVNENTVPVGPVFTVPAAYATGLVIGTLQPGEAAAFWIRRNVPSGTTTAVPADVAEWAFGFVSA